MSLSIPTEVSTVHLVSCCSRRYWWGLRERQTLDMPFFCSICNVLFWISSRHVFGRRTRIHLYTMFLPIISNSMPEIQVAGPLYAVVISHL